MKKEKKLEKIAKKIAELENKIATEKDTELCENQIMELSKNLTLEEMLAIDDYIMSKRLLKR